MLRQRTGSLRRTKDESDVDEAPPKTTESSEQAVENDEQRSFSDTESVEDKTGPPRFIRQTETALSKAWVVALASPLANWLTGTDHVLYFLLVLLLIFYLHQVVEVPWNLYQNARARGGITTENSGAPAVSELRTLELVFLGLSMASPFFGAFILRFISNAIVGKDVISWFSITLFVLATGVRPWRHLVHRLERRTQDLHNVIHYTSDGNASFEDLSARLEKLERAFSKFKVQTKEDLDEVYDYAEEAVDVLDKSGRRLERKSERNDERIKTLEEQLEALKVAQKGKEREGLTHINTHASPSFNALASFYLPSWFRAAAGMQRKIQPISPSSPPPAKYPRSLGSNSPRLTTIPEETTSKGSSPPFVPYFTWFPGSTILVRAVDFLTFPLRAFVHFVSSLS